MGFTFTYLYPIHNAFPHSALKSVKLVNFKLYMKLLGLKIFKYVNTQINFNILILYSIIQNIQCIPVSKHMDL